VSAKGSPIPFDAEAEAALVGGAMLWPDRIEGIASDVAVEDFYVPAHRALWAAVLDLVARGVTPDAVTLADHVRAGQLAVDQAVLARLLTDSLPPQRAHAEIVLRHAAARRALLALAEARQGLDGGADPVSVAGATARALDAVAAGVSGDQPEAVTIGQLVERADTSAPWVIPGLLRQDWRCVIVAGEGAGKSTLLRQLAVCAAQGVHPLRFDVMPPVRTLIVDAENSVAAIAETGARLDEQVRRRVGDGYDAERCRVWSKPGGIDLRDPKMRGAFVRELRHQRPALVVAGPVYKLGHRREREGHEDLAEGVQQVLDELRTRFGFALVLEHHAPKGEAGGRRDLAPFGSQRWLAWPELGFGLYPERDGSGLRVGKFRGDRMASLWPDRLVRDQVWPFSGCWERGVPR